MSRTRKFFFNSFSTATLQVFIMLAGFITPRIILEAYGSEINGLVSSILQFISYFTLVEAGLSGAAVYALYKPLASNDFETISGVASAAKKYYIKAGYIFLALIVVLSIIYPAYVQSESLDSVSMGFLVLILGVSGTIDFFTLSKYRTLLTADQKMYIISIASIVQVILNTVIIIIGVKYFSIVMLRLVALSSVFTRSLILFLFVKFKYKEVDFKAKPITAALKKRWDVLYLQVLGVIQKGAPILILTVALRDLKVVSVYAIFNMVVTGINGILNIFNSGLGSSFGDVIAKDQKAILQRAYGEFEFVFYSLITVVYATMFITIMPFIRLYTQGITDVNYNLPIIGALITLNSLLYNLKTPQGMLVYSAGLFKETRWQTTIQGIIALAGTAILSIWFGLAGVIVGMILSNVYRDIDLLFFIPRHVTKTPVWATLRKWIKIAFDMIFVYISVHFVQYQPTNYMQWFIYAGCIAIYTIGIVAITGLIFDREMIKAIVARIKKASGRKDDTHKK